MTRSRPRDRLAILRTYQRSHLAPSRERRGFLCSLLQHNGIKNAARSERARRRPLRRRATVTRRQVNDKSAFVTELCIESYTPSTETLTDREMLSLGFAGIREESYVHLHHAG